MLSKSAVKKCPLVSLKCPRGQRGRDFLNLLRSAVPQLAGDDKPFDILMLDKRRRLQPLTLKTVTPEEIIRNVGSTGVRRPVIYIRLKTQKEAQEEIPHPEAENSSAMSAWEENKQQNEMRTTSQPQMETENERLMISASGKDSLAPSAGEKEGGAVKEDDGDFRETNRSEGSWKLHEGEKNRNSEVITEKEEVDQSNKVWTKTAAAADLSCKVCKAAQESEAALIKHAWRHTEEAGSVCGVCGEAVEGSDDHFQREHRTADCPVCGDSFLGVLRLKEHLELHPGEQAHQTAVSHASFASDLLLENHQKPPEPRHKCSTCNKVFKLETQLKNHQRTHGKCKTYLCGVCGKFLSSNRSLSRHKMTHSGERPHRCQTCERGFKLATTLRQHEKIHTERERPFLCDVCCKMFLTSKQLVVHMRTHTNEKPYRCDRCGKGFTTRGPLTIHMRVHTGETPYRCPHCGWSFKRKTHLDDHVAIHTGAKPYVCGICGKTCARRTYLTVHMRTHNGERPYKCSLCEKAFTQSHCLKTHMKSHEAAPP
ncbi:zinc finger protein 252 isoform X2 [Fundulus heteroclitus]|nr:zinc finger protein 252 isoform X2 [Fundulus heteroclitus]